jgi:hypothetical protein
MRESQNQAVVDSEKARHWQAQIEIRARDGDACGRLSYGLECEEVTQLLSGCGV